MSSEATSLSGNIHLFIHRVATGTIRFDTHDLIRYRSEMRHKPYSVYTRDVRNELLIVL